MPIMLLNLTYYSQIMLKNLYTDKMPIVLKHEGNRNITL